MMTERFTLDTNILVYAVDRFAGHRFTLAADIVDRAPLFDCPIALQAVSEFYSAATRKAKLLPAQAAYQATNWLSTFEIIAPTENAVRIALHAAVGGRASYWDALLVATAAASGCTAFLTEDMADGTTFLGVRIINPFDGAALSAQAEQLLSAA